MSEQQLPYAEDVAYWRTSQSSPDTWIERAQRVIIGMGGVVMAEAFGKDASGRSAYMLGFQFKGDRFKVVWPVLPSKSGNERAARIQAATLLYHDIKARCISAAVLGVRAAFFNSLLLPDGRTAGDVAAPELAKAVPAMLKGPGG